MKHKECTTKVRTPRKLELLSYSKSGGQQKHIKSNTLQDIGCAKKTHALFLKGLLIVHVCEVCEAAEGCATKSSTVKPV